MSIVLTKTEKAVMDGLLTLVGLVGGQLAIICAQPLIQLVKIQIHLVIILLRVTLPLELLLEVITLLHRPLNLCIQATRKQPGRFLKHPPHLSPFVHFGQEIVALGLNHVMQLHGLRQQWPQQQKWGVTK